MAEVTQPSACDFNIAGRRRQQSYRVTGATGDTLSTGLISIKEVLVEPGTITAVAISGGTVTFTASGAFTNLGVQVIGN